MSRAFHKAFLPALSAVTCTCGESRRAFANESGGLASVHLVDISADARIHYHRRMTEMYYVLEGQGSLELDGTSLLVRPGDAILISPGCRHRAVGRMRILIVALPAYDPKDEYFDGSPLAE